MLSIQVICQKQIVADNRKARYIKYHAAMLDFLDNAEDTKKKMYIEKIMKLNNKLQHEAYIARVEAEEALK